MNCKRLGIAFVVLFTIFVSSNNSITAQTSVNKPDVATIDAVWKALSVFEGTVSSVTPDFDCQGMSIGVAQWNVGKSFDSVKKIITVNTPTVISSKMPKYGQQLIQAINKDKDSTFKLVRSLQEIKQPSTCDANERKATWNTEGKIFASELGKLITTDESIKAQRDLRYNIFYEGWLNANKWAIAYRGSNAKPTMKEITYFVDMMIFSGGGLDKFRVSYTKISSDKLNRLLKDTIEYLKTSNDSFLLHKKASKRNADLLNISKLNEFEAALFAKAYLVSKAMNAPHARQFKLTAINRKAAILFGEAYYADRDENPTKIKLPNESK